MVFVFVSDVIYILCFGFYFLLVSFFRILFSLIKIVELELGLLFLLII